MIWAQEILAIFLLSFVHLSLQRDEIRHVLLNVPKGGATSSGDATKIVSAAGASTNGKRFTNRRMDWNAMAAAGHRSGSGKSTAASGKGSVDWGGTKAGASAVDWIAMPPFRHEEEGGKTGASSLDWNAVSSDGHGAKELTSASGGGKGFDLSALVDGGRRKSGKQTLDDVWSFILSKEGASEKSSDALPKGLPDLGTLLGGETGSATHGFGSLDLGGAFLGKGNSIFGKGIVPVDWSAFSGKATKSKGIPAVDLSALLGKAIPAIDLSALLGKGSMTKGLPAIDLSALLGKNTLGKGIPSLDLSALLGKGSMTAGLPMVDLSALLGKGTKGSPAIDLSALLGKGLLSKRIPAIDLSALLGKGAATVPKEMHSFGAVDFGSLLGKSTTGFPLGPMHGLQGTSPSLDLASLISKGSAAMNLLALSGIDVGGLLGKVATATAMHNIGALDLGALLGKGGAVLSKALQGIDLISLLGKASTTKAVRGPGSSDFGSLLDKGKGSESKDWSGVDWNGDDSKGNAASAMTWSESGGSAKGGEKKPLVVDWTNVMDVTNKVW